MNGQRNNRRKHYYGKPDPELIAKAYFEQLSHKSGELEDDELENVSGGGCYNDNRLVVTHYHSCEHWKCPWDGQGLEYVTVATTYSNGKKYVHDELFHLGYYRDGFVCKFCAYISYEKGLWLCNNPANYANK